MPLIILLRLAHSEALGTWLSLRTRSFLSLRKAPRFRCSFFYMPQNS
jgi:hypothetical protein